MTRRIVGWFVLVPLCLVLVIFALANRHAVPVRFDPLSPENPLIPALDAPLFAVIFGMLIIGIVFGGVATWFAQAPNRREKRRLKKQNERLERELAAARRAPRPQGSGRAMLDPDDLLEDQ